MGAYNQDSNAPSGGIPSHQLPEIASYSAFMRANLTYLGMYVLSSGVISRMITLHFWVIWTAPNYTKKPSVHAGFVAFVG